MASTTTIAVSPEARESLKALAQETGDTMDSLIKRLVRAEQARRFGVALAERRDFMTSEEVASERALIGGSSTVVG
jgi:predicted DNA-binding protein